jgi:multiple sugar transport system ATP-binding protein
VVWVERLGDQTRLHLTVAGHAVITLVDVHTDLEPGDSLRVAPQNPLYFDATGARIA